MSRHPGFLWHLAHQEHGFSGLDADALRAVARKQWPSLTAEEIEHAVEQAIEWRGRTQRRLDPATTNVQDPREGERTMPTKDALKGFIVALIEDDPDIGYEEINNEVNKRFEDADYSRSQTSAIARAVIDERKDAPATNGAKPEPPKTPRTEEAAPAADESPATDSAGAEASGVPARQGETTPERVDDEEDEPVDYHEARVERSGHLRSELRLGRRTDRVQVDVDPATGLALLFVDVAELPASVAYRIAADVQRSLAAAAA